MKLEMGESLVSSWLKHIVRCKIVQLNWKVDKSWEGADIKEVKNIISSAKQYFSGTQDFSTQDNQPFLQQGEIDVLGYDWDKDTLYFADIAFHKNNLSKPYQRKITKKMIHAALIYKFYFYKKGKPNANIIFATPCASVKTDAQAMEKLEEKIQKFFLKHRLPCTAEIIYNDKFNKKILDPVLEKLDDIADTSELLVRSAQLIGHFKTFTAKQK